MSSPSDKVRAVLQELGIQRYNLTWQTTGANKPFDFVIKFNDVTLRGSTTRAIIRAVRRQFSR